MFLLFFNILSVCVCVHDLKISVRMSFKLGSSLVYNFNSSIIGVIPNFKSVPVVFTKKKNIFVRFDNLTYHI